MRVLAFSSTRMPHSCLPIDPPCFPGLRGAFLQPARGRECGRKHASLGAARDRGRQVARKFLDLGPGVCALRGTERPGKRGAGSAGDSAPFWVSVCARRGGSVLCALIVTNCQLWSAPQEPFRRACACGL